MAQGVDEERRIGVRRVGRALAWSIGGGAALTVLGAGAAHAQDATSTGNQSSTDAAQTLVVTPQADPTTANLHGTVRNDGASAANTGANSFDNTDSDTTASITPGNATAGGNRSRSHLDQGAVSSASGGGMTVIDQDASIGNRGAAFADTGFNADGDGILTGDADAWGNTSGSWLSQWAYLSDSGGATRIVTQGASIGNGGLAIAETGQNSGDSNTTGDASASGNESQTNTTQDGAVTGSAIGAATLEQQSRTRNRGRALANTGGNQTSGDDSDNEAVVTQNGVITAQDPEP